MKNYDFENARKNAIMGVLENALSRLPEEAVVTFRRRPGDSIQVCGMEMNNNGEECVRYIAQKDIRSEVLALLGLRDHLIFNTIVQLSKGLEVPAIQLDEVVRSVLRVDSYEGPLPLYADVFYRLNPLSNN